MELVGPAQLCIRDDASRNVVVGYHATLRFTDIDRTGAVGRERCLVANLIGFRDAVGARINPDGCAGTPRERCHEHVIASRVHRKVTGRLRSAVIVDYNLGHDHLRLDIVVRDHAGPDFAHTDRAGAVRRERCRVAARTAIFADRVGSGIQRHFRSRAARE